MMTSRMADTAPPRGAKWRGIDLAHFRCFRCDSESKLGRRPGPGRVEAGMPSAAQRSRQGLPRGLERREASADQPENRRERDTLKQDRGRDPELERHLR